MHTQFWSEGLKETTQLDTTHRWEKNIKMDLREKE